MIDPITIARNTVMITIVGLTWLVFSQTAPEEHGMRVPAYHASSSSGQLPPIVPASKIKGVQAKNAYIVAGKIPEILYQQPCYCYCDRSSGHKSLHDCFVNHHGSSCSVCQREVFFAYEQHVHGRTAAEIRQGIMNADWADMDISRYQKKFAR
jgi:hypothetical protein